MQIQERLVKIRAKNCYIYVENWNF